MRRATKRGNVMNTLSGRHSHLALWTLVALMLSACSAGIPERRKSTDADFIYPDEELPTAPVDCADVDPLPAPIVSSISGTSHQNNQPIRGRALGATTVIARSPAGAAAPNRSGRPRRTSYCCLRRSDAGERRTNRLVRYDRHRPPVPDGLGNPDGLDESLGQHASGRSLVTLPRVTVTRRLPPTVEARLSEHYDVVLNKDDHAFSADELRGALETSDALLSTVTDPITAHVLSTPPLRARIIANFGVGFNHIDLDAAARQRLLVTNTPNVLTDDTADLAIALMLATARRLGEGERELRGGNWTGWRPTHLMGTRVTGKTLGIVGFGRIGQAVARRAFHGLRMSILVASRRPPPEAVTAELKVEWIPLDDLLERADFVSLHVPANSQTHHLIDARGLRLMGPDAFLINTARGNIVDEAALIDALTRGAIAGAGLDVYEDEPEIPDALLRCPRTVLLPHLGSATIESRTAMGMKVVDNLDAFFEGREPPDMVGAGISNQ